MSKLDEAREKIGAIDEQMARLFSERMRAVEDVAAYKKERGLRILDAKREQELIERNSRLIEDPVIRSYYVNFLREEFSVSRRYQERQLEGMKIAYAGIKGAFANIAAMKIFPSAKLVSYPDFKSTYEAVERGDCDCCVLPIENSYVGEVSSVVDLMYDGSLFLNDVYTLRISQNLLGVKDSQIGDIKMVISHPQALGQCAEYISRHGFRTMDASNTALAARSVRDNGDKTIAAIASAETARLYGLKILDRDINTSSLNCTRFGVFSRAEHACADTRSSRFVLMFTVRNEAGALVNAINVISEYGFNMKTLRSHPIKQESWQYYFYVEAEGDDTDENGRNMIDELKWHCDRLKVVGRYSEEKMLKDGE